MSKSLIPLEVIASDICADLEDSTFKYKYKITRYLLAGYRKLNTFIGNHFNVKTCCLQIDNAVVLPEDFVYETKVGVMNNGRLAVLMLDPDKRCQPMNDTETFQYFDSIWGGRYGGEGYYFYNAFRGGSFLGELYGMGRGLFNAGTYSIDRQEGVLYVGSNIPQGCEIVVEYKSDGVSDGLKLVPMEMKECLEYYALSRFYANRNITQSQINENKYLTEYYQIKRLYNFRNALYIGAKTNEMFSPTNY